MLLNVAHWAFKKGKIHIIIILIDLKQLLKKKKINKVHLGAFDQKPSLVFGKKKS